MKRKSIRVDGTFDLECASWTHFILAVTNSVRDGVRIHYSRVELVNYLLTHGGTWWAHNGGKYDLLAIVEELRERGLYMSISLQGERVSRAVGQGLTLCDSYSLLPFGLELVAELGGRTAPRLGWPCQCGESCGGYCSITRGLAPARRAELADYCVADTESLHAGLDAIAAHAERHDYDLRGTIGGAAWATARRQLGLPDADLSPSLWRRIRGAYHGGRVSVFRPRADHGRHWDLSSAYPAALGATALPIGDPVELGGAAASRALGERRPGIYSCTVTVPDCHIPPLPWVCADRTAFPVGEVHGVWTLPELEAADARGVTITAVRWAVVWPEEQTVFGDLMRAWTGVRAQLDRESPAAKWQRLFANSLTGKLAEQPERRFVVLHPPKIRLCPQRGRCARTCRCGGYKQVDFWGELWSVPYYRPAPSGYIHWAAYVTAVTRVAWLQGAESQGDGLAYGDTDSLWTTSRHRPHPDGEGLGEWSLKHTWGDWRCAAPKSYSFVDGRTGEVVVRSSGSRLTWREWRDGEAAQDRGVMPLLSAARAHAGRGLFRAQHHRWTLPTTGERTGWYGDRMLDGGAQVTHPVTCNDLQNRKDDSERAQQGKQAAQARPGNP